MVTTANNNAKVVSRWIKTNTKIQKRKFYNIEELFYMYNREDETTIISKLSFVRNLNKCVGSINSDYKLEKVPTRDRRKSFRYIMLPKSEEYNSNIRVSTRKQGSSVAIISPPHPDPSPPDTPVLEIKITSTVRILHFKY